MIPLVTPMPAGNLVPGGTTLVTPTLYDVPESCSGASSYLVACLVLF